jgi:V/A-type H+-transporting ATPase subunit A
MKKDVIFAINGPIITVKNTQAFFVLEMVYVGHQRLMGEVISINQQETIIQVYESTTGLKPLEPVEGSGQLFSIQLGPGLVGNIYDGIGRPLNTIAEQTQSAFIPTGAHTETVNMDKKWPVTLRVQKGQDVHGGMILATIQETKSIEHRVLIPADVHGYVESVFNEKSASLRDVLAVIKDPVTQQSYPLYAFQVCAIKQPRPIHQRLPISTPLITGQRIVDALFPIAKGGTAAMPGGFGTGKTMMQHQLAKWSDADLIVYIGCGERGNEMTQALEEFSHLQDPRTQQPLLDRTILIANTSNMPVAAREASIYTGITIAEYYRDMGYHVAVMADSTSRWAEALREISGRLEEMPAEEGFPAYLSSRISQFYERAGLVETLNHDTGSVTIIGAVSPQGSDFSEPVTQNTKRFVRAFWALDKNLAYSRHYPAVNWNLSYSEYLDSLTNWYNKEVDVEFIPTIKKIRTLLAEEGKLLEITKLIGQDVLPDDQKLIILMGKLIREAFLQQNAYHQNDSYVPLKKQLKMMQVLLYLYSILQQYIRQEHALSNILKQPIFEKILKLKYTIPNDDLSGFDAIYADIDHLLTMKVRV